MLIVSGGFVYELLVVWVRLFILLTGDVLDPKVSILQPIGGTLWLLTLADLKHLPFTLH